LEKNYVYEGIDVNYDKENPLTNHLQVKGLRRPYNLVNFQKEVLGLNQILSISMKLVAATELYYFT
jgi:hypothetical protein